MGVQVTLWVAGINFSQMNHAEVLANANCNMPGQMSAKQR